MTSHPYWRTFDGRGAFRPFANTEPLGYAAHALGALTFGSYLTGWRSISQPNLLVAASLGFSAFGLYLASIGAFFNNDVFHTGVLAAIGGLWAGVSFIYLPASGILAGYTAAGANASDLPNALAFYLLWWALAFLIVSLLALRRHLLIVLIAITGSLGLFVLSGAYFNPTGSGTAKAIQAAGYFFWFSGLFGVIHFIAGVLDSERHWLQLPLGPLRGDINEKASAGAFDTEHGHGGADGRPALTTKGSESTA